MADARQFSQLIDKVGIGILQTDFIIQFNTVGSNAFAFEGEFIDFAGQESIGFFSECESEQ